MSTPPGAWNASNTVTSWPSLASSPAAVRPAGPEPTMPTFLPVCVGCALGSWSMFACAQSAT